MKLGVDAGANGQGLNLLFEKQGVAVLQGLPLPMTLRQCREVTEDLGPFQAPRLGTPLAVGHSNPPDPLLQIKPTVQSIRNKWANESC